MFLLVVLETWGEPKYCQLFASSKEAKEAGECTYSEYEIVEGQFTIEKTENRDYYIDNESGRVY